MQAYHEKLFIHPNDPIALRTFPVPDIFAMHGEELPPRDSSS